MHVAVKTSRPQDVVTSEERRASYRASGRWNLETLPLRVTHHGQTSPDKVAVIDLGGKRRHTYAELDADMRRAATMLTELGVQPGDVVAVQLPNWYETVVLDLAVIARGAVLNTMLPVYRAKELKHMLSAAGSPLLITPATYRRFDHASLGKQLHAEIETLKAHLVVLDPNEHPTGLSDMLQGHTPATTVAARHAEEVSELLFTSGTEAAPKAIMHTEATAGFGVRAASQALGVGSEDVIWMPSPIGHSTGFNYGVRMALHLGATLCLQDQWDAHEAIRLVESEHCTYTLAATTFLSDVVDAARGTTADLTSMRLFSSGGAAVPAGLVREATAMGITVLRLYGSTEVLIGTWNRPESPLEKRMTTDGIPFDGVDLEVRVDGVAVVGEPGEIFVRSPSACVGFFNDPERTARTFSGDGWIASGDLGVIDDDGYLTIVGRSKEIIIRGGLNIAPREVEELILDFPEVAAVAVVALPHERMGEMACACVVLEPGAELSLDQLVTALKGMGLASYKLPERLEIMASLPSTSTGKIQKHAILEQLRQQ